MVLRALREPGTGRPAPLARLLAAMVVLCMIALAAPVALPLVRWFLSLF